MLTKSQLLERGWTSKSIEMFLGEPDERRQNPMYRSAAPMCLYDEKRVTRVEKSVKYKKHLASSQGARDAAKKAVETKRQKLLAWAREWEPKLTTPKEEVLEAAVKAYNMYPRNSGGASLDSDPLFLQRITMNYLRHECTDYEEALDHIKGKVGSSDAYDEVRSIIDSKLEPILADAMGSVMSTAEFIVGLSQMDRFRAEKAMGGSF